MIVVISMETHDISHDAVTSLRSKKGINENSIRPIGTSLVGEDLSIAHLYLFDTFFLRIDNEVELIYTILPVHGLVLGMIGAADAIATPSPEIGYLRSTDDGILRETIGFEHAYKSDVTAVATISSLIVCSIGARLGNRLSSPKIGQGLVTNSNRIALQESRQYVDDSTDNTIATMLGKECVVQHGRYIVGLTIHRTRLPLADIDLPCGLVLIPYNKVELIYAIVPVHGL